MELLVVSWARQGPNHNKFNTYTLLWHIVMLVADVVLECDFGACKLLL